MQDCFPHPAASIAFSFSPLPATSFPRTLNPPPLRRRSHRIDSSVCQYIRRHVNLFSVPHTVTEDLARQPTVTVKKITPASVREFLRRSQGSSNADMGRVVDLFGGAGGAGAGSARQATTTSGGGMGGYQQIPRPYGPAPPPDTGLLLELLEFCLSDCSPPTGDRPPGVVIPAASPGGGIEEAAAAAVAAVAAAATGATEGGGEEPGEAAARNSREAQEVRLFF